MSTLSKRKKTLGVRFPGQQYPELLSRGRVWVSRACPKDKPLAKNGLQGMFSSKLSSPLKDFIIYRLHLGSLEPQKGKKSSLIIKWSYHTDSEASFMVRTSVFWNSVELHDWCQFLWTNISHTSTDTKGLENNMQARMSSSFGRIWNTRNQNTRLNEHNSINVFKSLLKQKMWILSYLRKTQTFPCSK
jgi:hypothetical protein